MFDLERTASDMRQVTNQFFNQIRHLFEIRISPIGLQHGEFRVVFPRNAFIPKVAAYLENLVESSHEQPLQIKLRRDAQIKIKTQCLVMGAEWLSGSASGDRLQRRRFHFQKATRLKEAPGFADNRDALLEN